MGGSEAANTDKQVAIVTGGAQGIGKDRHPGKQCRLNDT